MKSVVKTEQVKFYSSSWFWSWLFQRVIVHIWAHYECPNCGFSVKVNHEIAE